MMKFEGLPTVAVDAGQGSNTATTSSQNPSDSETSDTFGGLLSAHSQQLQETDSAERSSSAESTDGKFLPADGNNLPPFVTPEGEVIVGHVAAPAAQQVAGLNFQSEIPGTDFAPLTDTARQLPSGIRPGLLNGQNSSPGGQQPAVIDATRFTGEEGVPVVELNVDIGDPDLEFKFPGSNPGVQLESRSAEQRLIEPKLLSAQSAYNSSGLSPAAREVDLVAGQRLSTSNSVISTHIGDSSWGAEFAGKVKVFVMDGIQQAKLQLSPPELGRLEIKISTEGDQAKIVFNVQNPVAREAIEQAMPRLREMLEQGGLQLAQSDVADQSQNRGDNRSFSDDLVNPQDVVNEGLELAGQEDTLELPLTVGNSSAVDYYI